MAGRKSGLGRGLEALIPVTHPTAGYAVVQLESVVPNPQQPREHFDESGLEEMAASVRRVGVLQPIVVRAEGEQYVLIAGERRCRAARLAGLTEIPAVIREADEETSLTEALIENLQREDLSPLEEAAAFEQLMGKYAMTHDTVAQAVGKSRSAVTNTIRLLQLPADIQAMLQEGRLSAGHARALLGLDDAAYAVHIAERAVGEGWSVRQVEDAVRARNIRRPAMSPAATRRPRPAAIIELEERLTEHLSAKVDITYGRKGGRIAVKFADLDDLERIYKALLR